MISRRILAAIALLCLVSPAMAQKTKAALTTEINTNWPDNSIGTITPAILRSTVLDIVNSYFDLNGTTSLSCAAHQWIAGLPTLSSITCTQPAFTDISGQASLTQLPTIGADTVLGSIAGGTPIALSQVQLTSLVNVATASLSGALPAWPNTTTSFFRGDGTYQTLNVAAISGFGTGVATALGIATNSAGGFPTYTATTWTPTLTCASGAMAAYTTQVGSYEQIGRHVTARFTVTINGLGTCSGAITLASLPMTVANVASDTGACVLYPTTAVTLDTSYTYGYALPVINTTTATLQEGGSGQAINSIRAGMLTGTASFVGFCEYHS